MSFPDWTLKAEELYKEGKSFSEIGRVLNVCRKDVSYYLQKKGHLPNHKFLPKTKIVQKNKKYVDENIFNTIDTEEKAYWLGFLYADGSVSEKRNTVELCLQEQDFGHIKKYKNFLKSEHTIGKKLKDNKYISYRLSFRSEKMKSDLINLGCMPNKEFKLKFPNRDILTKELVPHFIRGYVDGDGCITRHATSKVSLEVLGTKEFLLGITEFFEIEGHIYDFNHSEIKRFMIAGTQAIEILNTLYKNSEISLDRKKDLYNNIATLFRNE